jgi:hypothetical protein
MRGRHANSALITAGTSANCYKCGRIKSNVQETVQMAFKGKPPGNGAGDISKRTEALRPVILLTPKEASEARQMRRAGLSAEDIAAAMGKPLDDVEKVLVQMRMPRPETTRGTLNVTLAAHTLIMRERQGDEPIWTTMDRILDELLRLRAAQGVTTPTPQRRGTRRHQADASLPLLAGIEFPQ